MILFAATIQQHGPHEVVLVPVSEQAGKRGSAKKSNMALSTTSCFANIFLLRSPHNVETVGAASQISTGTMQFIQGF